MTNRPTASLDHAERVLAASVLITGSDHPHDLLVTLLLALATAIVDCNPINDLEAITQDSARMVGPALAEMIGKVRNVRLAEAKPEGTA
jgi:hypothetical protein